MESIDIRRLENISGLRLLRSICRLGTLSAAAEEQKLSISAASHQLAVMKDFFKDELFQRSGRGLIPNSRMGDLLPRIIQVLDGLDALNEDESFDPGKVKRQMRILCYGVGYFTFILPILSELFAEAPGLHLSINFYPKDGKAVEFFKKWICRFWIESDSANSSGNPYPPSDNIEICASFEQHTPDLQAMERVTSFPAELASSLYAIYSVLKQNRLLPSLASAC